jgi:hypothetical protein
VTRDRCYDFLNVFAEKFSEKIGVSVSKQSQILKKLIITLVFEKNANFFAKNCRKSQKIVIITSTPDEYVKISPLSQPAFSQINT